ncbi:MAG: peptidoglycan bridge formation glycyltransferase FemA/FemB family protein [Anaerolineae bacterium]|jgi:lipid II:glycine glycyltransferase (peptidoglycan interpeptide bridge formation enzyme)|nr:peptidoglycan bridge formation glycyltransferase FemA/FemB family protein [Anaerolineae bacterium]
MKLTLCPDHDRESWNARLRDLPAAHILQTWEWGAFKQRTTGWQPHRLLFEQGGEVLALASVGLRRVAGVPVLYAPKGPIFRYDDTELAAQVLDLLQRYARRHLALWLKIDPDIVLATGVPGEPDDTPQPFGQAFQALLRARGWRFSQEQVQFRHTITIDLTRSEDELLAAFSQNTRRKVRTGEKKGVSIRPGTLADLDVLYDLYQVTGARDGFLVRPRSYYLDEWRSLMQAGLAQPLLAEVAGTAIAHVILLHVGQRCWYFYGASSGAERERMPNYALQWAAMQWAKAQGYRQYDLWGAPDTFNETDRLWGVYEFKRGFRGVVTRHIGAWDYAPFPLLYRAYADLLPRLRRRR